MKIIIILQGLLLRVLSQPHEECHKEEQQIQYHVYNANVEIKMYPCILTSMNNTKICEAHHYRKSINYPSKVKDECIKYNYPAGTVKRFRSNIEVKGEAIFVNVCEFTGSAKLLAHTVGTQTYSNGRYYNPTYKYFVFWPVNDCHDIHLIYTGLFDVWIDRKKSKYINNKHVGLKLTDNTSFCNSEIWKTDNDGIFVSIHKIESSISMNLYKTLNSTPRDCKITSQMEDNSMNPVPEDTTTKRQPSDQNEIMFPQSPPQKRSHETKPLKEEGKPQYLLAKEQINELNILVMCLMFVAALFALCYLFNAIVNFLSLWRAGKARTSKSRTYLLNCVSQSLTNRYLFLDKGSDTKTKMNVYSSLPHLYECVEYGRCNKPT